MNIKVEYKKQEEMRYNTLGDYFYEGDLLVFQIVEQKNPFFTRLILIHELIEFTLCEHKGVTIKEIEEFDFKFENLANDEYVEEDEPGNMPSAPYHKEHVLSEIVERLMCNHVGVNFKEYNNAITRKN